MEPDDVVAWALERIAAGNYFFHEAEAEKELTIYEPEFEIEFMESEIGCHLDDQEALSRFQATPCKETLKVLLENCMALPRDAEQVLAEELENAPYELCLEGICREIRRHDQASDRLWLRAIEAGKPQRLGKGIHRIPMPGSWVELRMLRQEYARDLAWLFPKIIRRAKWLTEKDVADELPMPLNDYLYEASKCFVYGRWIACIVVCRAALEVGLRLYLVKQGKDEEALKDLGLGKLLAEASALHKWKLQPALSSMSEVNRIAKPVVHPSGETVLPDQQACKNALENTRSALREILA